MAFGVPNFAKLTITQYIFVESPLPNFIQIW